MTRCADFIFGEIRSLRATSNPITAATATSGIPKNIPIATGIAEALPQSSNGR